MHATTSVAERVSIVLIEENIGDASLIKQIARKNERPYLDLTHARSLSEARISIENERPDAVLLDLNLSECRGLETVKRVRAIDQQVPIVVLSGSKDEDAALAAVGAGAQDFLVKGELTHALLARTLRYAIAREKQSQQFRDSLQRLARAEKLEAVGRLAAGVVHDFNNLLTVVQTHASLLRRNEDPQVREHAQAVHTAVHHAASLTDQLLAFCRGRPHRRTTLDLGVLVTSMMPLLRRLVGEDIHIEVDVPRDAVHVIADRGQMEQVVLNLVLNARDAVSTHGTITVRLKSLTAGQALSEPSVTLSERPHGFLSVSDDGPGMDSETMSRVFEPFFTTKDYGHGLGLASVFGVVQQCNGMITVDSLPGNGTEFRVYVPAPPSGSSSRSSYPSAPELTSDPRNRRVLLIEDDDMLRDVVCVALQQVGYEVLSARDGVEALALARARGKDVHFIVTDISLPGVSGTELAAGLTQHCENAPILFVSGWTGPDPNLPELSVPTAFLPKPFSSRDLLRALDKLSHARAQVA